MACRSALIALALVTAMTEHAAMLGTWMHSHEESEGDRLVYRPSDYAFPPARGRYGMSLMEDGVAQIRQPGPDDRPVKAEGSWRMDGDLLVLEAPGWTATYRVESVDERALILRRLEKE